MFERLMNYFIIFCLFGFCYAHNVKRTCPAHKTRLFYDLLLNLWDVNGFKKYVPNIDSNHFTSLDYDDSNFTDQCPSLILDSTTSSTDSLFLNDPVESINFEEKTSTKNESVSKNDSTEQAPIATFEEWTKQKLEKEKRKVHTANVVNGAENGAHDHVINQQDSLVDKTNTIVSVDGHVKEAASKASQLIDILPIGSAKRNYASKECGSKVISANEEAENKGAILNDKEKDEYMRNPCEKAQNKFLVVELCETIQLIAIELANFELFSSSVKEFRILVSQRFPTVEWTNLGEFVAEDTRGVQGFKIPSHSMYAKFLRIELLSHYGKEHFCTLSALRAYGISMVDEYEAEATVAEILVEQQVQVPVSETTAVEQEITQHAIDNALESEIMQQMALTINDDIIDEPTIDGNVPTIFPIHQVWQFLDCHKCARGQPRSVSTWLCYVFSSNIQLHSKPIIQKNRTFRSAAQIKFLKNILKPLPMCLKSHPSAIDSNQTKPKVESVLKFDDFNLNNEIKIVQQTIVKSKESFPTIPLPAGATSHKESVFLKLNKRLTALELNISLSSEYLSELSRRYVAQIEESKRENEKNMKVTEETIDETSQKLKKQFTEQIRDIKLELKTLTKIVKTLSFSTLSHPFWRTQKDEQETRELSLRTCSRNGCDGEYVGIYLNENDKFWTTNQLLVILAMMEISTIIIIFFITYFWRRHYSTKERFVLLSSDIDVRNMIQDEIKKGILAEIESMKIQSTAMNLPNVTINDNSLSKKKKKKKNQSLIVPEPISWDSTSCSSFSPADHDSASITSTDMVQKGSITSQNSFDVDTLETDHDPIPYAVPRIA